MPLPGKGRAIPIRRKPLHHQGILAVAIIIPAAVYLPKTEGSIKRDSSLIGYPNLQQGPVKAGSQIPL